MAGLRFGLDIGGTKIAGAAIGPDGATAASARRPNPPDYAGTLAAAREVMAALQAETGVAAARVGVGVSGTVLANGTLLLGTLTWAHDRPMRDDLAQALGAPVRLANDADCFALSEATDGAAAGARGVYGVILGTGFGGGYVRDGALVTGARGVAGEIGHIPLPRATAQELAAGPDSAGLYGCTETFLSGTGLAQDFRRVSGRPAADGRAVAEMAEAGDADALAAMDRYENRLGRTLALIVNIVEPDVFVFGGGLSNVARIYAGAAAAMPDHVFGGATAARLTRAAHGDSSGVRGAARLWGEDET